jgi:hypothetical protein
MVRFASPSGASLQKQNGGGMTGFFMQCANSASIGIQVLSWDFAEFRNIAIINPATIATAGRGIDMNVVASLGDPRDNQNNKFSQISIRCVEGNAEDSYGIMIDGDASANTSMNVFEQIDCLIYLGPAFQLRNSDNNLFVRCRAYAVSGSAQSINFAGSNDSANQVARTNIFFHFSSNVYAVAMGTSSYTYASANNSILLLDQDNSSPEPYLESNATLHYTRTDNIDVLPGFQRAAIGRNANETASAKTRIAATESLRVYNGSSDHMRLDDGTGVWGINVASQNLRLVRTAGTGYYQLTTAALGDYADDTAAAAGGVPVTGLYRTGSAIKIRVS